MEIEKVTVLLAGWCPPTIVDEEEAALVVEYILELIDNLHGNAEITLVSGLTDVGVMSAGYAVAEQLGWQLIGVACEKANKYPLYPVDRELIHGKIWGDESDVFTSFCPRKVDHYVQPIYFVNVGGGDQAAREEEVCRARGARIFSFPLQRS